VAVPKSVLEDHLFARFQPMLPQMFRKTVLLHSHG